MKRKHDGVFTLHEPVLVNEILYHLREKRNGVIVDCTCGGGGHARRILEELAGQCRLVCIDCDSDALRRCEHNLRPYRESVIFRKSNFALLDTVVDELHIRTIDACLFDLGLSSDQLADPARGFSFQADGPLDMRLDQEQTLTADTIVNSYPEDELRHIVREYGEDRRAKHIARAIVRERTVRPLRTTSELAQVVERAYPRRYYWRIHPATKTFQALRIAVNNELEHVRIGVAAAIRHLAPGGVVCVISFHSLEDRIVKQTFKQYVAENIVTLITKKPLRPQPAEIEVNVRARSAKLRIAKRSLQA